MATAARPLTGSISAASYVRVSTARQGDGESPDVQREAIQEFAARNGYAIVMAEEDHQSGHDLGRPGYQAVLRAARQGTIGAVLVWSFDRMGRDGVEWVSFSRELERLGVAFVSVKEGIEQPGILRYLRGGLNEEESRKIARRVVPAMERSVKESKTHHGVEPYGYGLQYAASSRHVPGTLTRKEPEASLVAEMFARYDAGQSLRDIVRWANSTGTAPRKAAGWAANSIAAILANPTYCGRLRYGVEKRGKFEKTAGDPFEVEGTHEALISRELFDRVQRNLASNRIERTRKVTRDAGEKDPKRTYHPRTVRATDTLGTGLLQCHVCGGHMTIARAQNHHKRTSTYSCIETAKGRVHCPQPSYVASLADAALLAQVRRLSFKRWKVAALKVTPAAPDPRPLLQRQRDAKKREMDAHMAKLFLIDAEVPEMVRAFQQRGRQIADELAALDRSISDLPDAQAGALDAQALVEEFSRIDLPELLDGLQAEGMTRELRQVVVKLVEHATIVERVPNVRAKWLRAACVWTPTVETLIKAGVVTLLPDVEPPADLPRDAREAQAARARRYYERKKAGLVGVVPARSGIDTTSQMPGHTDRR